MSALTRTTPDFQKSPPESGWSPAAQNLKFEREDWALFRTVEGLQQKAGVAKNKLTRLVLKELADNALDEGGQVRVGKLPNGGGYFIVDGGGGIDGAPADIARLFSISRPLISSKLLRLPTRGALGNGLRVVTGAVLASSGTLTVITRNRRIELRPEHDGTTKVLKATKADFPTGTRIEISFGPALPSDQWVLSWAQTACRMAQGKTYAGRSSPWWYDGPQFQELLYASGSMPVRQLIANLDGCTGATAGEIVTAARLNRTVCRKVTRDQATKLLEAARDYARPVKADRLGAAGANVFPNAAYAQASGVVEFGSVAPLAEVPFVVESWAEEERGAEDRDTSLLTCINRTPVTGSIYATRDKRDIHAFGCGLAHTIAQAPIEAHFNIVVNIISPYVPITSDGKEPNLEPFLDVIQTVVQKVVRKARRPTAGDRTSQKDIVLDNLDPAIAAVSGDGKFRFNQRQLLYVLRKIVSDEIGRTLTTENFNNIITDYENEHGEIPGMYREPRGSIFHPHRDETITLGTLMVEDYKRPFWTFDKLIYIEKEGWLEALKAVHWPERHDCSLMSSKGFTTRAVRDLVDKLAEHDEPVTVFCVHDADAYGTMIYQTFQEATKARGARKIQIVNLGLEPWEAVAMGLEVENVEKTDKRKPVADYVRERTDGSQWEQWLQTHRVELNAMTTPQFIAWLDDKMAEQADGKLVPPPHILEAELNERIEQKIHDAVVARILQEANVDAQVAAALAEIEPPDGALLAEGIKQLFHGRPDAEWRDHIEAVATELANTAENGDGGEA
jgi:hypothetical protein